MRRALACALLLLASAAPALAGEVTRRFAVEYGGGSDVARVAVDRDGFEKWIADAKRMASEPSSWDASKLGPLDVVAKRAAVSVTEVTSPSSGVRRLGFLVKLDDAELPSGDAAVQEYADRLSRALVDAARAAGASALDQRRSALVLSLEDAQRAADAGVRKLALMEATEGGPPPDRLAAATERLRAAEVHASDARIGRAVTAKKLESARASAQLALDIVRLKAQADQLERRTLPGSVPPGGELDKLRAKIDEATAKSPSLETARERVFDLEVELIGLETRETMYAEEVKALRDDCVRLAGVSRLYSQAQSDHLVRTNAVRDREKALADDDRDRPREVARIASAPVASK